MNTDSGVLKKFFSDKAVFCVLFILSFILYGNTLGHNYCLDDAIVITNNKYTQQGVQGIPAIFSTESMTGFFGVKKDLVSGARYRPLSIATFAVEQSIFHDSPTISHLLNVLFFAMTVFFIFLIFKKILGEDNHVLPLTALITALFFLFHPIHTEVVANIKGRDEMLALFLSLSSCLLFLKFSETNNIKHIVTGSFLWFLALLSKENALVFIIIIPLLLYVYKFRKLSKQVYVWSALVLTASVFMIIRFKVLGHTFSGSSTELMNNSYLGTTSNQKFSTICVTLFDYLKLLIFPYPLTYDYYPYQIPLADWSNPTAILGLVIYIVLGVVAIGYFRPKPIITFGIALFILPLSLVSNIFFPIGTMMSERFIYFSSLAFCFFVSWGGVFLYRKTQFKLLFLTVLTVVLIVYSVTTIMRNKAWKNNYTLFTTDVKTSDHSAKGNCTAGGVLLESLDTVPENRKQEVIHLSIQYLKRAVQIYPHYNDAILLLGNAYQHQGNCIDSAMACYSCILSENPNNELAQNNMIVLSGQTKSTDQKISILLAVQKYNPQLFIVNNMLGLTYGKEKNDLEKAVFYLKRATEINPHSKDTFANLGTAYGLKGQYKLAVTALENAYSLDSTDINVIHGLITTYMVLGEKEKMEQLTQRLAMLHH